MDFEEYRRIQRLIQDMRAMDHLRDAERYRRDIDAVLRQADIAREAMRMRDEATLLSSQYIQDAAKHQALIDEAVRRAAIPEWLKAVEEEAGRASRAMRDLSEFMAVAEHARVAREARENAEEHRAMLSALEHSRSLSAATLAMEVDRWLKRDQAEHARALGGYLYVQSQLQEFEAAEVEEERVRILLSLIEWLRGVIAHLPRGSVVWRYIVDLSGLISLLITLLDDGQDKQFQDKLDLLANEVAALRTDAPDEHHYIIARPANVRREPTTDSESILVLAANAWVREIEQAGDWIKVGYFDFASGGVNEGWMHRSNLVRLPPHH